MSHTATDPAAPTHPDPNRAVSARLHSAGLAKILHLLRTLCACSRNLIATPRQEDDPADIPWYAFLTRIPATTHPVLITVFIIRGLLRLAMLQARLSSGPARLLRLPFWKGAGSDGSSRRAGRPMTACPHPKEETSAKIVTEDRERPIGAILLYPGIMPALIDLRPGTNCAAPSSSTAPIPPTRLTWPFPLPVSPPCPPSPAPYRTRTLSTPNRPAGGTDYRSGLWTNSLISEFASWASCEPPGISRDFRARPLHVCPLRLIDTAPAQVSPAV